MSNVRFPPIPVEDLSPQQKALHERIASGPRAGVRGPYPALMRHPELAFIAEQLGYHVRYKNVLPENLKELAILVTARHWSAQYEWYAHRVLAERQGVPSSVCDAIARGEPPRGIDADETMIYEFASQLLAQKAVDDVTFGNVKARFGEIGVLDLIALIGHYSTVAMILNVDRHPVPEGPLPLTPLA